MIDEISDIIICPYCWTELRFNSTEAICKDCSRSYEIEEGQLDARLSDPVEHTSRFRLEPQSGFQDYELRTEFEPNPAPDIDLEAVETRPYDEALVSHVPETVDGVFLDLGCGSCTYREFAEEAGYNYIGTDIDSDEADILADARRIPIKSDSVNVVYSFAVFEHVSNPFVMAEEIERVLQPGGLFIGSVAFGEPLHGDSRYHQTPLGFVDTLNHAGLEPEQIAPVMAPAVDQIIAKGLFPSAGVIPSGPHRIGVSLITTPLKLLSRLWYRAGYFISDGHYKTGDKFRILKNASHIATISRKPET